MDDSLFASTLSRQDLEYILSQAAAIEYAVLEGDVERVKGEFHQVVVGDRNFSGAYSLCQRVRLCV
jgi:hypothetical protein